MLQEGTCCTVPVSADHLITRGRAWWLGGLGRESHMQRHRVTCSQEWLWGIRWGQGRGGKEGSNGELERRKGQTYMQVSPLYRPWLLNAHPMVTLMSPGNFLGGF